jgi:predicted amidohydrolase YtcJ
MRKLFSCIIILVFCSCKNKVDLIIHHGVVYTVDATFSTAEAIAVKDGKIVAVGKNDDIMKNYVAKENVDAQGNAVYPGFIDAHAHFVGYAQSLFEVNLYGSKTWDEVVERVKAFADKHPNEAWIIGRGWDQNLWPGKQFPTNDKLNELFPTKPVYLTRVDGHAGIANITALNLANVHVGQTLTGGQIEVKNGKLTGILVDNAKELVSDKIPALSQEDYIKRAKAAQQNCFEQGLTRLTECGVNYKDAEAIDKLQQNGIVQMKFYIMLSDDTANYNRYLSKGPYKTNKIYIKGIKVYADGALGSRGACLLKPYNDKPNWQGFLLSSPAHFDSVAAMLVNTDFQMCTHAIGDSANRVILHVYAKYLKGKNDKRWRIEHAQTIDTGDVALFGKYNIIPSVQPTHATSDMYWAIERLGAARLKSAYIYEQLLQQNGWLPLGTDFPVEDISPFKTFYAAVARKDIKGLPEQGFQTENALTREQALRGMTIWAAKADFLEKETGSIEVGKQADIIIVNNDLMRVKEEELLRTKVIATYIDGKKVY